MSRAGRRWRTIALSVVACLVLAGCASRDTSADDERRGGFYGGVSGGTGM
ncbi:MAG TPA: hypothetical protein VEK82_14340 [Stellaceae bacterium]|nr:hypothetical protein [Stellaceae bacterium]